MIQRLLRTARAFSRVEKAIVSLLVLLFLWSGWTFLFGSSIATHASTYTEGLVGKSVVLNPLFADFNDVDRDISHLLFSGLLKYDAQKGAMVEDMAFMKLNADQTIYTFMLRDRLFFHDGKPVTIDDVYFTYHDIIQSPEFTHSALTANFQGVKITKKDNRTIVFSLSEPNSFFMTNLALGILPKHVFQGVPPSEIFLSDLNKIPIGSGPYMLDRPYSVNAMGEGKITLRRFDSYYGGRPKIPEIVIRTFPTVDRLISHADEFDSIPKVSGDFADRVGHAAASWSLDAYRLPQYKAVFFNMSQPFMQQKAVRLALVKSVDKTQLLQMLPYRSPVDTPLMDLRQDQWVFQADKKQADGALFDAGFRYVGSAKQGFRRSKKGYELNVTLAYFEKPDKKSDNEDRVIAQFLKQQWETIGVKTDVQAFPYEQRDEIIGERKYDALIAGESLGYDLDTYSYWHSSQISEGGSNLSSYKNLSADALIEDVRRYIDPDRKAKRLNELAKTIRDDIPALFLFRPSYFYANDRKIIGANFERAAFAADRFWNVSEWVKSP